MSSLAVWDEVLVKRVVRYLTKHPRCVVRYKWQEYASEITVYTD